MHNIEYGTYAEKVDKAKVQKEWDNYACHNSDSGGDLGASIRWIDHICSDYDEAVEYIKSHDRGWYDQLAVKYRTPAKPLTSKTLTSLKERREKEWEKIRTYTKAHSVKMLKAEFIGCPCCGSKLKRERLMGDNCPLCRTDLRSKTTLTTLEKYNNNIQEFDRKIKEEQKSLLAKSPSNVQWLVKIEYHS